MMSGCFSTKGRPLETVVNHTIGKNGTSMTFKPGAFRQNIRRRRDERRISFAVAHRFPVKLTALGFLHLAIIEQPGLLDEEPSIQTGVLALGRDFFAFEIGNFVDARVGAHDQPMIQQTHGLAEVNPFVAHRTANVGRKMIAADEFDRAVGDVLVRILRSDLVVVIHVKAVLRPGTRVVHDVKKRQMAVRAIGKVYFVHDVSSLLQSLVYVR